MEIKDILNINADRLGGQDSSGISLTPHIGAATVEAQERIGTELAEKIIHFYNS